MAGLSFDPLGRRRVAALAFGDPRLTMRRFGLAVDRGRGGGFDARRPLAEIVERLNDFQPDAIGSYPLMIGMLARDQLAGRLHVAPRAVLSVAEYLGEDVRELTREAWGSEPYDCYGLTELPIIAAECREHRGLHLFEDLAVLEVVDGENQPVADGTRGEKLLLTSLFHSTQPLIRYEVTDLTTVDTGLCACGLPFRRIRIEGRSEEIMYFRGQAGETVSVLPGIFDAMAKIITGLAYYRVTPNGNGVSIAITPIPDADVSAVVAGVKAQATSYLTAMGVQEPRVEVEVVNYVQDRPDGKHLRVRAPAPPAAETDGDRPPI